MNNPLWPQIPRVRLGEQPTAAQFNAVVDALNRLRLLTVSGDLTLRSSAVGISIDGRRKPRWKARITSAPGSGSGSGGFACEGYEWEEVYKSGCDWVTLAGGRSGTFLSTPGRELNGDLSVATGTIVEMWYSDDEKSTEFSTQLSSTGTNRLVIVTGVCLTAASSGSG